MGLADALRRVENVHGWDWSRIRDRMEPFGWSYTDVVQEHLSPDSRALDIGTGGGEVFSAMARPQDVALDMSLEMLAVARRRLPGPVVGGDHSALPLRDGSVDLVADRHVGADPREVVRVLRPCGVYVSQGVGGRICQNIFEAFGWGSNEEFWQREARDHGIPYWNAETTVDVFLDEGCEILRREEALVDYEFLDEESLAFWLANAPLPETVDPERHADVLESLPLKTNWHAELLVVRR